MKVPRCEDVATGRVHQFDAEHLRAHLLRQPGDFDRVAGLLAALLRGEIVANSRGTRFRWAP